MEREISVILIKLKSILIRISEYRVDLRDRHALVAQKVADEVVFRRFQGEGVEFFFKLDLTDPPQIFYVHLLESFLLS